MARKLLTFHDYKIAILHTMYNGKMRKRTEKFIDVSVRIGA